MSSPKKQRPAAVVGGKKLPAAVPASAATGVKRKGSDGKATPKTKQKVPPGYWLSHSPRIKKIPRKKINYHEDYILDLDNNDGYGYLNELGKVPTKADLAERRKMIDTIYDIYYKIKEMGVDWDSVLETGDKRFIDKAGNMDVRSTIQLQTVHRIPLPGLLAPRPEMGRL